MGVAVRIALLLAIILTAPAAAQGIPEQVHVGQAGDEMSLVWARAGDVGDDVEDSVEYAWTPGSALRADAFSERFISPGTTIFTASIPPPFEGDQMRYRVGSDRHGWSGWFDLQLRPTDDVWRFAAYGDQGSGEDSNNSIHIVHQVAAERPHAVLHLGDLSYANGHAPTWDAWFRMIEPLAATTRYMAAPGNHEHEGYYAASDPDVRWATETDAIQDAYHQFTSRFHFAADDLTYSFDVGPVHVAVINTESLCVWQPAQYYVPWRANPTCDAAEDGAGAGGVDLPGIDGGSAPPNQELIDWLEADLAANADATWTFVIMHQPTYSSGAYDGRKTLQDHYVPLFQQYGVDLVMAGHDHNYQRSHPLIDHVPASTDLNGVAKGVAPIYIVSGGAGDGVYSLQEPAPEWAAVRNATYHYTRITLNETWLLIEGVKVPTGEVFDRFAIGPAPDAMDDEPSPAGRASPLPVLLVLGAIGMALAVRRR